MNRPLLFRLNKWVYFVLALVVFALGILFVFLSTSTKNNAFLYLSVIFFMLFTFTMQAFMSRAFKFKSRRDKYVSREYELIAELDMVSNLKKAGFLFKKNTFGHVAVKVDGKSCYKVTIIDDVKAYLSDDKDKVENKKTPGIDKCQELVGFEFFTNNEENVFEKIVNLSFNGDKVFYEAYKYDFDNNKIIEVNAISPTGHEEAYKKLKEIIGLKEIVKENE